MSVNNSFVQFSNNINVNFIKVEKLDKEINDDSTDIIIPTYASLVETEVRETTSLNTILFTTFNIDSEKSVDAYYFPPENKLGNAEISIYRKTPTQTYYDYICELKNGAYEIYDYNVKSGNYYHYLVAALIKDKEGNSKYYIYDNKDRTNSEIYTRVKMDQWYICNVEDSTQEGVYLVTGNTWTLGLNFEGEDITQNYGVTSWDTLGRYSKFSQGAKNYASGTFTGLLGKFEEYKKFDLPDSGTTNGLSSKSVYEYTEKMTQHKNEYATETEKLTAWLDFCSDGELKLLRDTKGNAWLVQIAESFNYKIDNTSNLKQTTITFSWKEAEDVSSYSIIGL